MSPHHTICRVAGCGCILCLLMYSWDSTEREVPAQYIPVDGKIIKVPAIKIMSLAYSVCGICTILVVMVAAALTSGIYS